jgi:hypothetical protein
VELWLKLCEFLQFNGFILYICKFILKNHLKSFHAFTVVCFNIEVLNNCYFNCACKHNYLHGCRTGGQFTYITVKHFIHIDDGFFRAKLVKLSLCLTN